MAQAQTRICVGTDFSAESGVALCTAATVARSVDARVDLVTVIQLPSVYERILTPVQARLVEPDTLVERSRERLHEVAEGPELRDLPVDCHVRVGVPYHELVACAQECDDRLLIVGSPPRSGLNRLLLGSTADRVLRKASVPVLIARVALAEPPRVILAPTDFSSASRPAVLEAAALARRWNARLELLHVIEPAAQMYGWAVDLVGSEIYLIEPEAVEPEWSHFIGGVDLSGLSCEHRTIKGLAAASIAAAAEEVGAGLVVMGTHGHSGLAHVLLGSVAEGVAREAGCGVLTVRPDAQAFARG